MENASSFAIIRDLVGQQIDSIIEDMRSYPAEKLWWTPKGIANSGGVLAQHLVGNLNHFIGHGLGNTGYVRHRDLEFSDHSRSKEELIAMLEETRTMVADVLASLDESRLSDPYPIEAPIKADILSFIIFLFRHLAYHHGQINYLRRIASSQSV